MGAFLFLAASKAAMIAEDEATFCRAYYCIVKNVVAWNGRRRVYAVCTYDCRNSETTVARVFENLAELVDLSGDRDEGIVFLNF